MMWAFDLLCPEGHVFVQMMTQFNPKDSRTAMADAEREFMALGVDPTCDLCGRVIRNFQSANIREVPA